MLKNLMMGTAALALSVVGMVPVANATIFAFHAELSPDNNDPEGPGGGSGTGIMYYNDGGTPGVTTTAIADDTFRQWFTWSGLVPDNEATEFHNHLGLRGVNGGIIQFLDVVDITPPGPGAGPNFSPNDTGWLDVDAILTTLFTEARIVVGEDEGDPDNMGDDPDTVPVIDVWRYSRADQVANLLNFAYGTNLQRDPNDHGHLDTNWYVNIHNEASDPNGVLAGGAIRDQWQFTGIVVPEPASMSLLGAGIMGLGYFGRRNRKA